MKIMLPAFGSAQAHFASASTMSSVPRVAVIDGEGGKSFDIDGDGIPDVGHATLVERIIKSYCPNAQVDRFGLGESPINPLDIYKTFVEVAKKLIDGAHYDAINFSIGTDIAFQDIKVPPDKETLTPEALPKRAASLLTFLMNGTDHTLKATAYAANMIGKLARAGVPVYVGAGNQGPGHFNWYSLADGATNVAATDATGKLASYSSNHGLVNRFAQGTYNITRVPGGFDITGNGKPEILDAEVSGGESLVKQFEGKPIQEVQITQDDVKAIVQEGKQELYRQRLFSWQQLINFKCIKPEDAQYLGSMGEYAMLLPPGKIVPGFRLNNEGKVYYNPDGSNRRGAVSAIHGTSFAAPTALGQDLAASQNGQKISA